jgi:hypothetical protein
MACYRDSFTFYFYYNMLHKVQRPGRPDSADILVPKLRYNKRSAYTETPTPPSSKRRPHFETRTCLGENKNLGHGSRRL